MEEDSTKLHSIFEAFVKVKNEILGIQIQESLDEDEQMEVEESHVCEQTENSNHKRSELQLH